MLLVWCSLLVLIGNGVGGGHGFDSMVADDLGVDRRRPSCCRRLCSPWVVVIVSAEDDDAGGDEDAAAIGGAVAGDELDGCGLAGSCMRISPSSYWTALIRRSELPRRRPCLVGEDVVGVDGGSPDLEETDVAVILVSSDRRDRTLAGVDRTPAMAAAPDNGDGAPYSVLRRYMQSCIPAV
ncbi:hypothetical protein ACLOJK_003454 [Asimina triloba]